MKAKTSFFIVALVCWATVAMAEPPLPTDTANTPKYNIGDTWVYNNMYGKKTEHEVKEIKSNSILIEFNGSSSRSECSNVLLEQDLNRTTFAVKRLDGSPVSECDDYFKGWKYLDFPIHIGKKWSFDSKGMSEGLRKICSYSNEIEVLDYEDVTIPVGTFKAYKIKHMQQNHCHDSRVAIGQSQWYSWGYYWYAPELKAAIKRIDSHSNISWVLISYKLK